MVDVITCTIFGDCRLRDVGVVKGVILPSPIDLRYRAYIYNTGHTTVWPCDAVRNLFTLCGSCDAVVKRKAKQAYISVLLHPLKAHLLSVSSVISTSSRERCLHFMGHLSTHQPTANVHGITKSVNYPSALHLHLFHAVQTELTTLLIHLVLKPKIKCIWCNWL